MRCPAEVGGELLVEREEVRLQPGGMVPGTWCQVDKGGRHQTARIEPQRGCCLLLFSLVVCLAPATARASGGRRTEEPGCAERKYGRGVENGDNGYEEEGNAEGQKVQESVWMDSTWLL